MFNRFRSSHAPRLHQLLPIALGTVVLALVPVAGQAAASSSVHVARLQGGQGRLAAAAAAKKCRRHKPRCVRARRVLASTTGWRGATPPGTGHPPPGVRGTPVTPTPVPGKTLSFGVRVNVSGAPWSSEVKITYAAASTSSPGPTS